MSAIQVVVGDLLTMPVAAIVNPAHPSLLRGSGLCGIIHRAAGIELELASKPLGPLAYGEACITPGFQLTVPWVIHTPPPKWLKESEEEFWLLRDCFFTALSCAVQSNLNSLAFPAMGIGVNRFPPALGARAAAIGIKSGLLEYPIKQVFMTCMTTEIAEVYRSAFQQEGLL